MSGWLGAEREHLEACASTNDEAAARARRGAAHGTVITAGAQSAGRGRRGRSWHSPAGENLYLSCVLRPALDPRDVPPIALVAGVAIARAVNRLGAETSVKWPNDVLIGGRKLAGVLCEMSTRTQKLDHVILGIGINVGSRSFPPELEGRATSLAREGIEITPPELLERLLPELESWLERFESGGVAAIAPAWEQRMARGQVRAGDLVGEPIGLDPDGALRLRDASGDEQRVVAGDVEPTALGSTEESR